MADDRFDPAKIGNPFQMVGALVALLLVVEPAFITAASVVSRPTWLLLLFSLAAVLYPPGIVLTFYRLLTKHRGKLLDDKSLADLNKRALELAPKVDRQLDQAGLTLDSLLSVSVPRPPVNENLDQTMYDLMVVVDELRVHNGIESVPPEALLESAKSLMARRQWSEAADYFDAYVKTHDTDWRVQFSRGVAHANSRLGSTDDIAALRAYNDAIALAPRDLDAEMRARLLIYRAGVQKRIGLLDMAWADLTVAQSLAKDRYDLTHLIYNEACVLAMMGKQDDAIEAVRRLVTLGGGGLVRDHLSDYFRGLLSNARFLELVRTTADEEVVEQSPCNDEVLPGVRTACTRPVMTGAPGKRVGDSDLPAK